MTETIVHIYWECVPGYGASSFLACVCVSWGGTHKTSHPHVQPAENSLSDRAHHEVTWISLGVNSKVNTNGRVNKRILITRTPLLSRGRPNIHNVLRITVTGCHHNESQNLDPHENLQTLGKLSKNLRRAG